MRAILIVGGLILMMASAHAQSPEKAIAIGPWQIEASFTQSDKFDRCVMSRTTENGIETRISRDKDGLTLAMSSPRWKLDKGKKYDVEFAAGSVVWKSDVTATAQAVRVALTDQKFNDALRTADSLDVRGAGSTISVSLDKSAAALSRLDSCYETNIKAVETNPFVAPSP
jgi:hypothetical protein